MKPHKIPLHRFLLISLLILSMLTPGLSAFAQAADDGLTFTLSVEPGSLTKPGTVTVSARVSNAGTTDLNTPMSLYDPDGKLVTAFSDGGSLMSLPSGENYLWSGQYEFKQTLAVQDKGLRRNHGARVGIRHHSEGFFTGFIFIGPLPDFLEEADRAVGIRDGVAGRGQVVL